MPNCGTTNFNDTGDYQASIRGAKFNLTFSCQRDFEARLTWVELRHLRLLRGQENLPRVAHISLPLDSVFIALPIVNDPPLICDGVEVLSGDIVFHSLGGHMHQRTRGPSQWSFIALAPEYFAAWGRTLTGFDLVPPSVARILRPSRLDAAHLSRLHAAACRLVETNPEMIAHQQVARAIEQDLLPVLVNCLMSNDAYKYNASNRNHADIIARFEDVLAAHPERHLQISELCEAVGVPERTLRMCCAEFLGMGPNRYLQLRRLNMAHAALRDIISPATTVEEAAKRYGFSELGRFAANYRKVFGETPSATLRYARTAPGRQSSLVTETG
jgi:AraC-like DNA-binding protein